MFCIDILFSSGFTRRMLLWVASLALALLALGRSAYPADDFPGRNVSSGLSVQFTDNFLKRPDWRQRLDFLTELGARIVRIDLNWPWIEQQPGRYDWTLYDDFASELRKRGLRPLFILNRPNPLYGKPFDAAVDGKRQSGTMPPYTRSEIAAYARWATAAADRYRQLNPILELWNEPDQDGFWPPKPDPAAYVALAREACASIKQRVPDAIVTGPGMAQMPTVWRTKKPLMQALLDDHALLSCLDAVSLHTHRFKQTPETVSRDYAVLRANYLDLWPAGIKRKPIIDTEWGDSVYRAGISEDTQALWLPRMFLINLMEQVRLTNWYCLIDVGPNDDEMEDRFGLVSYDGRPRPAYQAFRTLAHELGGLSLHETIERFDATMAEGITILRFCGDNATEECKLVYWATEGSAVPRRVTVPGWRKIGPAINYLGQQSALQPDSSGVLTIEPKAFVQYLPVASSR